LIEGRLSRNVDVFTKMDVYVLVVNQGLGYKTNVHEQGGIAPKWNQTLEIPIFNLSEPLKLMVMDFDINHHDEIGSASLKTIEYLNATKTPS
jgi:Ca2+-dependent lipid-binding protein